MHWLQIIGIILVALGMFCGALGTYFNNKKSETKLVNQVKLSEREVIKEIKSTLSRINQEKGNIVSEKELEEDGINYYEDLKNKNANFLYLKGYEPLGEVSFWFAPGWPNEVPQEKFYLLDFVGNLDKNRISLYVNEKKQLVYQVLTSDGRNESLIYDISHWRKEQAYFIVLQWITKEDKICLVVDKKIVGQKIIPNLHFDVLGPIVFKGVDFEGKFPAKIGEGFPVKHEKTDDIWKAMGQPGKEYKKE